MLARWISESASYFGCSPGEILVTISTVLLVVVTLLLVLAGAWSVGQVRQQRKASIRPIVIFQSAPAQFDEKGARSKGPVANLLNQGPGIAINVRAWSRDREGRISPCEKAAAVYGDVPHWLGSWYEDDATFWDSKEVWIRYEDAEHDAYFSHWDNEHWWHMEKGLGRKLPDDVQDPYPGRRHGV